MQLLSTLLLSSNLLMLTVMCGLIILGMSTLSGQLKDIIDLLSCEDDDDGDLFGNGSDGPDPDDLDMISIEFAQIKGHLANILNN